jgi:mono/diheme cytochrome c family protein
MNRRIAPVLAVALAFAVAIALSGCGSKPGGTSGGSAGESKSGSKYDSGPRAGESPVNEELAETGEKLFQLKGCSACHTFGKKMSGPDLQGVTMRRTATWMEHQILHPEVMVKEDPISRDLMAKMALQMPNQGLTPDEAKAVIEFLKHKDQEAGLAKSEHE